MQAIDSQRGSCTPSRCAGGCGCASVAPGSTIARTCSCSSNPADIRWRTFRRPTSLQAPCNGPSIRPNTRTSGSRPGTPSGRESEARREERGGTLSCPPMRGSCRHGSRSPGRPWMLSTKRTNGSWAMPQIAITASTSARPLATWWSAIVTAGLRIPSGRWSCTSPASRRAGTLHAATSINPP